MKNSVSPSIMCADFSDLGETLKIFEAENIEYIHTDIMDGSFVPNFTLGTDFCRMLKERTRIPIDLHLMIDSPEKKLGWFSFGEGDIVSIHFESTPNIRKALDLIKERGAEPFIALNPATPISVLDEFCDIISGVVIMAVNPGFAGQKMIPSTIDKIENTRKYFDERGLTGKHIEADGNVSFENALKMKKAGADIFVGGTSSVFSKDMTVADNIRKLRNII